ncbi:MAG TPA: ATP phosphoribosyltransferase [Polyangiales bacterium]|nr:ATP phosphoribosyltransferase [Polyangiales bacterium]
MPKQASPKRGASRKTAAKPALDPQPAAEPASEPRLVIAIPKGRVLGPLAKRLKPLGVDRDVLLADDRTLVRDDPTTQLRFLLLKPDDVPTYVEYGSADLGIVGRDVLLEREYDVYAPLDLGIGICRMVVAGKPGAQTPSRTLRVATKFPNIASRFFLGKGQQVDIVFVQGSVELAPLTGLADVIVDLVESGETLRQNGLVELDVICPISSVVIANRVALKLKRANIAPLLEGLRT